MTKYYSVNHVPLIVNELSNFGTIR